MPNPLTIPTLEELRRRTSIKWRAYPEDVLPAWVAEMDVRLAPPVAEAITDAVESGDTGYAVGSMYAEALADYAKQAWDLSIDPDRTAIVPDVMLGVVEVLKLVTGPGDAVVVNRPVYPPFEMFLTSLGRRVVDAPLDDAGRINLDTLAAAFVRARADGRRAAYLLCSPHNPTGAVHTLDELTAVTSLAGAHGVRVVADEIHAPLVYPGATFVPILAVPGSERCFSVLSASKAWNLAGLKAALAIAGEGAADELAAMPEEVTHGPSHVGVIAHAAAFRDGREWLADLLAGLDGNRHALARLLESELPTVGYRVPDGTFFAWLDCRALGLGDDPAARFLERGRVAVYSGPAFGAGGSGFVRLNIATSPDLLSEAVRRMAASI
jgi:cysteine-S-conjugate beta-lyase